jgi:hypothetical protein
MKLPVDFLVRLLTMITHVCVYIYIYIYKVCGEVIKESI